MSLGSVWVQSGFILGSERAGSGWVEIGFRFGFRLVLTSWANAQAGQTMCAGKNYPNLTRWLFIAEPATAHCSYCHELRPV